MRHHHHRFDCSKPRLEPRSPANGSIDVCGMKGFILPILNELGWHKSVRIGLYFFGMLYVFLGISIAADVFMAAIQQITSHRNRQGKLVWNPTVANLSLMALGSSAPEIMLSVIEVIGNGFHAGALGPSTIVGSAAFNLLCISAGCVFCIPNPEIRRIEQIYVFGVTSTFGILAYIWLLIILKAESPNEIEIWEALLTLLFFGLLLVFAYVADKQFLCVWWKSRKISSSDANNNMSVVDPDVNLTEHKALLEREITLRNPTLPGGQIARLVANELLNERSHDRIYYRLKTTKWLSNQSKAESDISPRSAFNKCNLDQVPGMPGETLPVTVEFEAEQYAAVESEKIVAIRIKRTASKDLISTVATRVRVDTIPGTAQPNDDYTHISEVVWFEKGDTVATVDISLIKDIHREHDETFYVKLHLVDNYNPNILLRNVIEKEVTSIKPFESDLSRDNLEAIDFESHDSRRLSDLSLNSGTNTPKYRRLDWFLNRSRYKQRQEVRLNKREQKKIEKQLSTPSIPPGSRFSGNSSLLTGIEPHEIDPQQVTLGKISIAEITIYDDSDPAETKKKRTPQLGFERRTFIAMETVGCVALSVRKKGGGYLETTTVGWKTMDGTAKNGDDFIGGTGKLTFLPHEVVKNISIPIINDLEVEKSETFKVKLTSVLSNNASIRCDSSTAMVTIVGDEEVGKWFNTVDNLTDAYTQNMETFGASSWADQFCRALNVNEGHVKGATGVDYVYHTVTFGWKVLLAFVPPPTIAGGWLTFCIGMCVIGILTAIVSDFATIFGCLVGLKDEVTAITFVALGTSLPDMFASRLAAVSETTADSSIGNIMGSNSVNVFLGLGIPWTIASMYWAGKKQPFCVYAGNLSFTVTIFLVTSVLSIMLFALRRKLGFLGRAELGGPFFWKIFSAGFLLYLWIIYITLSSLQAYGKITGF